MGIRNKVTSEIYSITSYDPLTGEITGINLTEGNTDLGNVTTVFIGGGNPGEVLSTDGTGNLSWIPDGGGGTGDITFVGTTISAPNEDNINIQALNNDGVISSGVTFRPGDTYMRLEQWSGQDSQSFTTADWATGTYTTQGGGTIGAVEFTGATNIINFTNSLQGVGQVYFSVNGGPLLTWDGTSSGGTGITFYTPTLPDTDPTTVTSFEYYYSYYSRIVIDYDSEEFNIDTNGLEFVLSTTNGKDIELNSARQATIIGNGAVSITNFSDTENVYITTDAANQINQWQFLANAVTVFPGDLVGSGASPAPSINGFDSASFVGNITAGNIITGNITTDNIIGTSANVDLVAGSYTATFDNTGILTLPTIGGDEGGEINFGIPATNTTLIGPVKVDVFQDRIRFFDGSTKGAYIDLSQAAAGVNTLLNNRVSAFVNAGVFVTMDNIQATITTSANRGLSLATTTGTFTYNIGGTYGYASGGISGGFAASSQTLTTTPTASIFGWDFPTAGDTATYILTDTTNNRAYRITIQIGASFNNNSIIIERLI